MKPIGTITMYFPFLDADSRNLLQSIMDDATNYYDFVRRLNEVVLSEVVPDLALYFAIHHAALLLDMEKIEAVGRRYGKLPILRPNLFFASVLQGNLDDIPKVHEAADAIISSEPARWLEIEMRFMKFEVDLLEYPKVLYDVANLDQLQRLINSSSKFEFFENILFDCLREKATRDGDSDEALRNVNLAIESAETHDDRVRLAYHIRFLFDFLRSTDLTDARDSLTKAYHLMEELGNQAGMASLLFYVARTDAVRGEYNLAIDRILEVIRIRQSLDLSIAVYAVVLSTYYNAISEPATAMEWARLAEAEAHASPIVKPRGQLNRAWALILMQRYEEALALIDSAREIILSSGVEILLGWLSFITGVYELAQRDTEAATKSLEEAIGIYEQKGTVDNYLIFLQHLAQLDVAIMVSSSGSVLNGLENPWLQFLEDKAIKDNLPGISGKVLLMKAKVALARNDEEKFEELIFKIREMAKEPGMVYLRNEMKEILELP
ncbi:MAG: hypothetical protein ACFFF4_08365 [Candidatus Thorarchaeota archaeon]